MGLLSGTEWLFQLNSVSDGFRYKGSFEFFFDGGVVGSLKFSDLASDSDNKAEGSLKKEDNGSGLRKDIGSFAVEDSGFIQDFKIFLHGAIGSF